MECSRSQSSNRSKVMTDIYLHQSSNSPLKVGFPKFDGTQPRAWIFKCNTYFKIMQIVAEDRKINLASMHFQGRASL